MNLSGRALHFVGIGGAGMSGLATVAVELGASVTGSDRQESPATARLGALGVNVTIGHSAIALPAGAETEVVVSTAIPQENAELASARERGLMIHHRGDLLAEVTRGAASIAVAGAHGKTTTTAMIAHVLKAAGKEPGYLIGGDPPAGQPDRSNAHWGAGEWIVVEADESDRSFLKLVPDVAVITNIELDHHATYGSTGELESAFREFATGARAVVAWGRCARTLALPPGHTLITFECDDAGDEDIVGHAGDGRDDGDAAGRGGCDHRDPDASLVARNLERTATATAFTVEDRTAPGGPARARAVVPPGDHNVLNALAAIGACLAAGVDLVHAAAALERFPGVARRFEPKGEGPNRSRVFDDYAHHPTEVSAALAAARQREHERVVAVFQPHLFSRTQALAAEFGAALAAADLLVVLDVYAAREQAGDFPGVSGELIAAAARSAGCRRVEWQPTIEAAARWLTGELRPGDLVLTIGAGDVVRVADRLVRDARGDSTSARQDDSDPSSGLATRVNR